MVWVYFGLTADEKGVPVPSEEHVASTLNDAILLNYHDNIEYRDKMWDDNDNNGTSENSLLPIPTHLQQLFLGRGWVCPAMPCHLAICCG